MEGLEMRAEGVENEASQTVAIQSTRDGKVDN